MTGNRRNVNDTPIARAPQARAPDGGGEPAEVLSVVIPVFNEHQTLEEFHRRLVAVLADIHYQIEILYVDDGSRDASLEILRSLRQKDSRITLIELSRNFGKEAAMTAGLDYAVGDAVLRATADGLRSAVRRDDLAARLGGDEFGLLLPGLAADHAAGVVERIRSSIHAAIVEAGLPATTCSVGYATSSQQPYVAASAALQRAKQSGRDRIAAAS